MSFVVSKVFWVFASPANIFVLLLLLGGFFVVSHRPRLAVFGRILVFNLTFLFFLIAVLPIGVWMLVPLENRFPPVKPEHVDGIILLGGGESPTVTLARNQPEVYSSSARYIRFVTLANEYPEAKLAFTGGSGRLNPQTKMRDAEVAKQILAGLGVPRARVVFEDQSRNTYENAVKTKELLKPTPQQKWLLVTSANHMPRAMGVFKKAGWNVEAAPADYLTDGKFTSRLDFNAVDHLFEMHTAMHEYFGLLAYRLMGYTDELWPD